MTDDSTAQAPRVPGSQLAQSVGVVAHVLSGPSRGTTRVVGQRLTIGTSVDNHLVLVDRTVSRRHCELVRTGAGIVVRDLGSTNGTFVDGTQVVEALVGSGATLRVGAVDVALRPSAQPIDVPPSVRTSFGKAVGRSLAMRALFGVLEVMAPSEATILLEGETGTGKELLARAIVRESRRRRGPFVTLDCSAVSPALLESELFGHEKGAFTGALTARQGIFESAAGGTVFLDHVDELPLELQPKLLRVLEAREVKRLGGRRAEKVDVRIVAACRRDLSGCIAEGSFREDLYFRLAVVPIRVPPLRRRRDDIPLLVASILGDLGADTVSVTDEVMSDLLARAWRGNVRELRNVLERALHLARAGGSTEIDVSHVPPGEATEAVFAFDGGRPWHEVLRAFERSYALWLVARHGSAEAAAAATGAPPDRLAELAALADASDDA